MTTKPPFPPYMEFLNGFHKIQAIVHNNAKRKGFWIYDRNDREMITIIHSELSRAFEALCHGNPASEHIPPFTGAEEEFADVIIRIMDMAQARGWRIAEAVIEKMKFNEIIPYNYGKKF